MKVLSFALIIGVMLAFGAPPPITENAGADSNSCWQHSSHYREDHYHEYCRSGEHWNSHNYCSAVSIDASMCDVNHWYSYVDWCGCVSA